MLLYLWLSFVRSMHLNDGQVYKAILSDLTSTSESFKYIHTDPKEATELIVLVSCNSDVSDPHLMIGLTSEVTKSNSLKYDTSRNHALIRLSTSELEVNQTYHLKVTCEIFCAYSIHLSLAQPISLSNSVPILASVEAEKSLIFAFELTESSVDAFISARFSGDIEMLVYSNELLNSPLPTTSNWIDDLEFYQEDISGVSKYIIVLKGKKASRFTLLAKDDETKSVNLIPSIVYTDTILRSGYSNFYISIHSYVSKIEISLTVFNGDADLYLSFSSQPTNTSYDIISQSIGNDYIKIDRSSFAHYDFSSGRVYISVHGYTDTSFSIVCRLDQFSSVPLLDGVPQQATILDSELLNFNYEVSSITIELSFYLTTFNGDADLFVKFCYDRCHITKEDLKLDSVYKSIGSSSLQSIDFRYEPEEICVSSKMCNFAVAVYAKTRSYFSLTAATLVSQIKLQQGLSFIMSSPVAGVRVYEYSVTNPSVFEVDFTLTPILGDPDICVKSQNYEEESCEVRSDKSGVEIDQVVFIKGKEKETLESLYLVSVTCFSGCYYSIIAREKAVGKNNTLHLIPGHPQKDTLFNVTGKDFRLYYFNVDSVKSDLKIVLTGITGKFSMFVSNNPDNVDWKNERFDYNWKVSENDENSEVLVIRKDDKDYLTDSTYLILVKANKFTTENSATYSIQFARSDDVMMLTADVNAFGQVQENSYAYYSFPVHYSHMDIKISLMVSTGDPDLYISFDYLNSRPSKSLYSIRSSHFGSETLTLLWDDEISKYCPDITKEYTHGNSHGCFIYIAVYSLYPSAFTLRVSPISEVPKYMNRGGFVHSSLSQDEYDFYYLFIDVIDDLIIILQNARGESDLLVSLLEKKSASSDIQEWERPTEDFAMIKVKNLLTEEVKLSSTQLFEHCSQTCIVLISVKCVSSSCVFLLENPEENLIKLNEGQAKYGMAGKETQFYSYVCDKEREEILIVVTPIENCNPSLYVAKGKTRRPGPEDFDWSSESSDGDSVKITSDDSKFDAGSMIGTYVIGVQSESDLCSFTLTVTNHEYPVVVLNPGLPQQGTSGSGLISYYALYNSIAQQIKISVTPNTGSPFILVSIHKDTEDELYADLPTYTYFKWNSKFEEDKYSVTLKSSDTNFCTFCYYLIGIASEDFTSFTVIGNEEVNMKVLQNGVPYKSELEPGNWDLFSFSVNVKKGFRVILAEYSGELNFEVSLTKDMNDVNWQPVVGLRTKNLEVLPEDDKFKIGTYYLRVTTSSKNALYSLVWYSQGAYISLIDGWSMIYSISAFQKESIKFKFDQTGSVFCSIESLFHQANPSVSAFLNPKKSTNKKAIGVYSSLNYTGNHLSLDFTVPSTDTLTLLINDADITFRASSEFSLYCTASFHPAVLTPGKQSIGHLSSSIPALRYEFTLSKSQNLNIYVIPCEGSIRLQASTNWTILKGDPHILTAIKLTDGAIVAQVADVEGKVYLSVLRSPSSLTATFKIYADDKRLPRLYAGKQGFISWTYNEDRVKLEWSALEYANGSIFDGQVTYYVFYTEDSNVMLQSTCQAQYAASHSMGSWISNTRDLKIEVVLKTEGFVTIVAHVEQEGVSALRDLIYDKTKITGTVERAKAGRLIFLLSLIVLVLFAGLGIYFWKFRKAKEDMKKFEDHGKQIVADENVTGNVTINDV